MEEKKSELMEKIRLNMQAAMKSGEKRKLETLRMILSEIKKEEIDTQKPATDENVLSIIKRGIKTRQESISQFEKGGRMDLVEKEKIEQEVLKAYLPSQLAGDALRKIVDEVIATLKAVSKKDMGLVMKTVMSQYGSQVDGKEVQSLVSEKLK